MDNKIIKRIVVSRGSTLDVVTDEDCVIEPITKLGILWFKVGKKEYNSRFVLSVEYK